MLIALGLLENLESYSKENLKLLALKTHACFLKCVLGKELFYNHHG